MTKTFVIADTHFGHYGTACVFTDKNGVKIRPFSSVEEQDNTLIKNWNSVVSDKDRVYHLGDFCMNRRFLSVFNSLKGRICFISGNHDVWKLSDLQGYPHISHILGVKPIPKMGCVLSHVPLHPDCISRWGVNVHGHLHQNVIKDKYGKPDPRYKCVSVEQTNYFPVELSEVLK